MLKTMAAPVDLARQAFNVGGRISLANIGPIGIQNAGKFHTYGQ